MLAIVICVAWAAASSWSGLRGDTRRVEYANTGLVPLDPFVVTLADEGAPRFLRVRLALLVENNAAFHGLDTNDAQMMQLRSGILDLLGEQQAVELTTTNAKSSLKRQVASYATSTIQDLKVKQVTFSEFVVQ